MSEETKTISDPERPMITEDVMTLTIPQSDYDRLARFVALDPKTMDSLYDALKDAPPRLRPLQVVDDIAPKVPIARAILVDVIRLLFAFYTVRADQDLTPAEMAEQLALAAQDSTDDRLKTPGVDWPGIKPHLARLLDLDQSFGITAKAVFVAYQYAAHFHSARILTDARPLFTKDPTDGPSAFIINHTFNIAMHTVGDDDNDVFASISSGDLTKLRATIDRALAKETSLRATLSKTGLPILTEEATE